MAILSDYHPETVSSHLDEIRDQLGILQASAVPDETTDVLSSAMGPSDPDVEDELAEQLDEAIYNAWEDDPTPMPGQVERNEWLSPPPEVGSSSSRPSMSSRTLSSRSEGTSHSAKSTSPTSVQEDEEWPEVDWQDEVDVLQSLFPNQWVKVSRLNYEELELTDRPAEELRAVYDEATSLQAAIDQLLSIELIKEAENTGIWADEEPTSGYPSEPEEDWRDASAAPRLRQPVAIKVDIPVELLESSAMSRSLSSTSGLSSRGSASDGSSKSWQSAGNGKTKKKIGSAAGKKKTITVPLVDTLQRRATPVAQKTSAAPASNAWVTISSLAAHLAELFPEHNSVFFQSYLHSPSYRSAHAAVRASLITLPTKSTPAGGPTEQILQDLFGLALLPGELGKRKQADLKLAMKVGGDDIGVVMDLIDLLEEVAHWPADTDDGLLSEYDSYTDDEHAWERRQGKKVVRNAVPPPLPSIEVVDLPARMATLRAEKKAKNKSKIPVDKIIPGAVAPPSAASAKFARDDFGTPPSSPKMQTPDLMPIRDLGGKKQVHPQNWRKVQHTRTTRERQLHPYAHSIPSYAQGMTPHDTTPGSLYSSSAASSRGPSVQQCLSRAAAERARRSAAIRAVGAHFAGHLPGGKAINASVAGHYAAQAREAQGRAREWELQAARMVVGAQMDRTGNTVDLHHLTVDEAKTVAVETAERWWTAERTKFGAGRSVTMQPVSSLTVITGVGRHSVGNRGVLGPAVARELEERGWKVERGEASRGYLSVKGKR